MQYFIRYILLSFWLVLTAHPSYAAKEIDTTAERAETIAEIMDTVQEPRTVVTFDRKGSLTKLWEINNFMESDESIILSGASNSYTMSIPISDRIIPDSMDLNIRLYNSNKLIEKRSQFVVYINEHFVKQVTLDPINDNQSLKIHISGDNLESGYNKLTFKVAQHYTIEHCEDPSAPELWTQIDTLKTTVALNYHHKNAMTSLADFNKLINTRHWDYDISFLRTSRSISDDYLYWGALAAQGVKLRLGYVSMELDEALIEPYKQAEILRDNEAYIEPNFYIDPSKLDSDAILFGTKNELASVVSPQILSQIKGAYLGVFQQDADKHNFILIASGLDAEQVTQAVKAFSLMRYSFPDVSHTIIKEINFSQDNYLLPKELVMPGGSYSFSQLGYSSYKDNNLSFRKVNVDVMFPADVYSTEDEDVTLNLDLTYGAAIREDSVINVYLNDLFNHAIRIKEFEGAHYGNYKIKIPLRDFQAGLNTLTFEAIMNPSESGWCTYIQFENLKLTLDDSSLITIPNVGRAASLPDLKLLSKTAYPFVKDGSAADTYVELLDTSSDSIKAMWHLVARLSSFSQVPIFDIEVGQNPQTETRANIIRIGKKYSDPNFFDGAPLALGEWSSFPYPYKEIQTESEEQGWLTSIEKTFFGSDILPSAEIKKPNYVELIQSGGLGKKFLLTSYPSGIDDGIILALLGAKDNSIYSGLTTLLSSGLWWQLEGDTFVWDAQEEYFFTDNGNTIVVGDSSTKLALMRHFSSYPWQWPLLIIVILLFLSWAFYKLLMRFKRTKHSDIEEFND